MKQLKAQGYRPKTISVSTNISSQVRLEVLCEEERLLNFVKIDWEAAFKEHSRPPLSDLLVRTKVNFRLYRMSYRGVRRCLA